jgi:hypothetical protein
MTSPHFPGTVPLQNAREVFAWVGETVGSRARLVTDGETGEYRSQWSPHLPWLASNPSLEPAPPRYEGVPNYRVRDGAVATFEPFEFGEWARASHEELRRARDAGVLPEQAKLLVTMPFAVDALAIYSDEGAFPAILGAYVEQSRASVEEMAATIPNEDLAIQWDIPYAAVDWSGGDVTILGWKPLGRDETLDLLLEHAAWAPPEVEVGFHLCFGDGGSAPDDVMFDDGSVPEARTDASGLTELANALVAGCARKIDFLHLATYDHWLEAKHYLPLRELKLDPDTEVTLGVINMRRDNHVPVAEGMERARQRVAAAREAIGPTFGISTSCGLGRYTPDEFEAATALYREL